MTVDAERRASLVGAKLAGLVTGRWGPGDRRRGAVGTSATLIEPAAEPGRGGGPSDGSPPSGAPDGRTVDPAAAAAPVDPAGARRSDATTGGRRAWVLADSAAARALGPALVWADRHQVAELHLVADDADDRGAPGVLARQAAYFADPPAVWAVEGTSLVATTPSPLPPRVPAPAPPDLVDLLIDAGVEIVAEGGLVRGEINGLEVARIVHGETTAGEPIEAPQLEVGVGKADRELTAMVHSGLPAVAQLGRVVTIVREQRRPDALRHPLNQLVPDRWLRAVLCRAPGLVGLAALRPAEGPRPRPNLSERDVAIAVGEAADGDPVVVACSVGIALDLVPQAADARAAIDAAAGADGPPSRLILAVPERDDHPTIHRLAAQLRVPADVVPIPGDWRAAG
jgi:hypothetical protein